MKRKSYSEMTCPIARGLEHVGDWWNILILRDAGYGLTRFDHFEKSLGIAPNMLTRRLAQLVKGGLLEKRPYSTRPLRHEYLLTERGREFREILLAFATWGNRHFAPEGETIVLADRKTGRRADPVLIDRVTGQEITRETFGFIPGPAAGEGTRLRMAFAAGKMTGDQFIEKLMASRAAQEGLP